MCLMKKYFLIRWDRSLVRCKLILAVKYKMSNENISYFSSNFTISIVRKMSYFGSCLCRIVIPYISIENLNYLRLARVWAFNCNKNDFLVDEKNQHFTYFSCRILTLEHTYMTKNNQLAANSKGSCYLCLLLTQ